MSKIFIPYNVIKFHYPIIQKHKWLTPFMEIRRWGKLIFCGHLKRTLNELKYNQAISSDKADTTKTLLENMEQYGYTYLGMVPMGAETARECFKQGDIMVYALHPDGAELVIENDKQFDRHVENCGLFGIGKEDWMKYLENGEYLRTAEISTE